MKTTFVLPLSTGKDIYLALNILIPSIYDFFILKDGIQILCDVLYKKLIEYNVDIKFNSELNNILDNEKKIIINNKTYKYDKLYLTIKRQDYLNIPYFTKYEKILNNVSDGHLLRIYAQYKDV